MDNSLKHKIKYYSGIVLSLILVGLFMNYLVCAFVDTTGDILFIDIESLSYHEKRFMAFGFFGILYMFWDIYSIFFDTFIDPLLKEQCFKIHHLY